MADPILVSTTLLPNGSHDTVWSLRPGKRVHFTIPAGQYTSENLIAIQKTILPMKYPKEISSG